MPEEKLDDWLGANRDDEMAEKVMPRYVRNERGQFLSNMPNGQARDISHLVEKSYLPKPPTSFARGGRERSGYIKAINLTGKERDRLKTNISRRRRLRTAGMSTVQKDSVGQLARFTAKSIKQGKLTRVQNTEALARHLKATGKADPVDSFARPGPFSSRARKQAWQRGWA